MIQQLPVLSFVLLFLSLLLTPGAVRGELMTIESADGREMKVFVIAVWSDEVMVVRRDKKEFSLTYEQISSDSLARLGKAAAVDENAAKNINVQARLFQATEREVETGETRITSKVVTEVDSKGIPKTKIETIEVPVMRTIKTPPACTLSITNEGENMTPSGVIQWIAYSGEGEPLQRGARVMPALGSGASYRTGASCKDVATGFVFRQYRPETSTTVWEKKEGELPPGLKPDWSGFESVEVFDLKRVSNGKELNARRDSIMHPDFKNPNTKRLR